MLVTPVISCTGDEGLVDAIPLHDDAMISLTGKAPLLPLWKRRALALSNPIIPYYLLSAYVVDTTIPHFPSLVPGTLRIEGLRPCLQMGQGYFSSSTDVPSAVTEGSDETKEDEGPPYRSRVRVQKTYPPGAELVFEKEIPNLLNATITTPSPVAFCRLRFTISTVRSMRSASILCLTSVLCRGFLFMLWL